MQLGDIYKRLTTDHFVTIQSYGTMINKEYSSPDDILVIVSPLVVVDGYLSSDPAMCYIGTQREIEENYCFYAHQPKTFEFEVATKDIVHKIQTQDKIDSKNLDALLSDISDDCKNNLKTYIDNILKDDE